MRYRRADIAGATYFFTVNLADRKSHLLVEQIDLLRNVVRQVSLPDHLHSIWQLPPGDADFPLRWSLIKAAFSRAISKTEIIRSSRAMKRERGIWQRRYWEHQIRDDDDLAKHADYIHINPIKHGYVKRAVDWPYSSIHREIARENLNRDWGCSNEDEAGKRGEYGD